MSEFYTEIIQPTFAPPSWVFGPVWSFLYAVMAISFGRVTWGVFKRKFKVNSLIPIAVNLGSNLIWTPLFFGLKNFDLALADIIIVWGSIIWIMIHFWKKERWISYAQIPYLLWVSFASVLMTSIWFLN